MLTRVYNHIFFKSITFFCLLVCISYSSYGNNSSLTDEGIDTSLQVLEDTSKGRQIVRQLAKTIHNINKNADNEVLENFEEALTEFADAELFRGDRELLELRKKISTEENIAKIEAFNNVLSGKNIADWEKLQDSDVFDLFAEIVDGFGYSDVPMDELQDVLGSWLEGGDDAIIKGKDMFSETISTDANHIVVDFKSGATVLTDEAEVIFGNQNLKAGKIEVYFATNTVQAYGLEDSTGNIVQKPIFGDNGQTFNANEIIFNFKSQKGVIRGIVTEESDGIIQSDLVKKTGTDVLYLEDNIYTTCRLEDPHFGIRSKKLKVVPKKSIVSGPFLFELAGNKMPLGFFFGLFPATSYGSSGVVMPTWGESSDRGFYLRDGGFFVALNDYFNFKILGSIYTLGGWGFNVGSQYRKRYSFGGDINFSYTNAVFNLDDGNQDKAVDYQIRWNHRQESKKSGNFSASVNIANSEYNQRNSTNTNDYLSTTMNSNVSYRNNLTIGNVSVPLATSMRYQQNTQTGEATLTPDATWGVGRVRPFSKLFKKSNPLSELSISYDARLFGEVTNDPVKSDPFPFEVANQDEEEDIPTDDEMLPDLLLNFGDYVGDFRYGMNHKIPISTQIRLFKFFTFAPSFSYSEYWHPFKYDYTYSEELEGVLIDTIQNFGRYNDYNASVSMNTNMYLFYNYKGGAVMRHTMRPAISFSYRPDFSEPDFGAYQMVQTNENGSSQRVYRSQGGLAGKPGTSRSRSMSMSLSNQFELKTRKKGEEQKSEKMTLINGLNFATAYDFERDSLNWSDITTSFRTTILKKINVNVNATFDPYKYVPTSFEFDEELNKVVVKSQFKSAQSLWDADRKIASLKNVNIAIGTSFSPKGAREKQMEQLDELEATNQVDQDIIDYLRRNPDDYVDFSIPWSISLNYNFAIRKTGLEEPTNTHSVTFRGDLSLTPKWKVVYSSGYDIERGGFTYTTIDLTRDLHCWQMTFNWIPFGQRQSYNVQINVKSSVLQDLKWQKRNSWQDRSDRYF